MATSWISLLVICVSLMGISHGKERVKPNMQSPPLFNYGISLAGDNEIQSFDQAKEITLDFNITYFGSSYNTIYISKDGIISFKDKVRYLDGVIWSEGIRNVKADRPFMAPFYHDGHDPVSKGYASYQGKIYYRLIYAKKMETDDAKNGQHYSENKQLLDYFNDYVQEAVINPPKDFRTELIAIVTWSDVTDNESEKSGECDAHSSDDKCKSATFQAVIIADKDNTFAMFNYLNMEVPDHESYQAGFNGGSERGWVNVIPCLGDCSLGNEASVRLNTSRLNVLPDLLGSDYKGRYFLNVGGEEIIRGGCLPPDLRAGMLEVYPQEVGMFGGEKLEVSGKCFTATHKIYCRFGSGSDTFETDGVMTNDMKGYCPVPLMTTRGSIKLSWSTDGQDWSVGKHITVGVPSLVDNKDDLVAESDLINWHKRDTPSITVKWSPKRLSSNSEARVEIKLIGYKETGSKPEFKELENLGESRNSAGGYTFQTEEHSCTSNCEEFEMGLIEVALVKEYFGDASDRVAIRYGPMALGWYVNKELTETMGSDWSKQMCHRWYDEDKKDTEWRKELPKCPCNLDQALADFGRWQARPGCDLFKGSKCVFHKGAKHCVRSTQPTASDAGNTCCYHPDGTLMYTQLSFNGGGPSKSHVWGSAPFNRPGKVPIMSHMTNDVIPYIHCCYWKGDDDDLCHQFTRLRPTTSCDLYEVPGLAMVRGSTHITTFDGSTYNFGGMGDFWLLNLPDISIQGRFEPRRGSWDLGSKRKSDKTSWKPTALTHLAIQGSGVVLQFHPAPDFAVKSRGLDVLVGKYRHFFLTESARWQEFGGEIIVNNAETMANNPHNNFTVITNHVGINIVGVNDLLHVTVSLPPSMKVEEGAETKGMGLLGMFDGNHDNDYISKSNTHLSPGVKPETLFKNFGMSWAIEKHESMFYLEKDANQYKDYIQFYTYDDIPHDFDGAPTDAQISSTCDDDKNCMWDYRMTGRREVAVATKKADELFTYSQKSAFKIENCGLPAVGDMAVLDSYDFSAGKEVSVTGCVGDHSFDGQAKFQCIQERLEEADEKDRDDYGRKMKDNQQVEYMVHWVPKPYTVCSEGETEAAMGMIIGIVVAVVVVIIIAIIIVVLVMKKRNSGSRKVQKPRATERVRKDQDFEEGTEEPMMSQDRKPVYKPRSEARTSSAV